MSHWMNNVLILQQKAEMGKVGDTNMLKTELLFHSQFVLKPNYYRDNNNYLRHNLLKFTTSRWNLAPPEYEQEYIDIVANPIWENTESWMWELNTTRDEGTNFELEVHEMIFGTYFFLNEDKVERIKNLTNITEVIAILEGLASLVLLFVAVIP